MTEPLTKRSELLARLRDICLPLPECKETLTWGNPTFVAGKKQFAVLDRYHDRWCIAFAVSPEKQSVLLKRPGFFAAPVRCEVRMGLPRCRRPNRLEGPRKTYRRKLPARRRETNACDARCRQWSVMSSIKAAATPEPASIAQLIC